jgi:hypothetical protein
MPASYKEQIIRAYCWGNSDISRYCTQYYIYVLHVSQISKVTTNMRDIYGTRLCNILEF